jgi:non-heme chloroperoxidase
MSTTAPAPARQTAQLRDGLRLAYVRSGPAGGPVVVCIHGYSDSSFSFSRLTPLLTARGYDVVAPDLRGHGDSDRPSDYGIDEFADDVVAFLDAVGIDRATLVGHSMGSFVARRVAERAPERVERLVLIGSSVSPDNPAVPELLAAVDSFDDPVPEDFVREFQTSTVHAPVPADFLEQVVAESRKLPARVWRDVLHAFVRSDDAGALRSIQARTLVLTGDHDDIFGPADCRRLADALPDATLLAYDSVGHSAQWEDPERVAEDLDRFLRAD